MPTKAGTAYVDVVADFGPLNRQIARMSGISARAGKSFSRSMKVVDREAEASRRRVARLSAEVGGVGAASRASSRQLSASIRQVEASSERALRALRRLERAQQRVGVAGSPGGRSVNRAGAAPARIAPGTLGALNSAVSQAAVDAAIATAVRRATAKTGSLGGIASSGKSIAKAFAGNFAKGLAPGLASAGLEHILGSALEGDMKSAGFEAGGALVGGLVGALGGPTGAMLGAGIGAFAGDLGKSIFDDIFSSGKKLSPLQSRLKAESKHVAESFKRQRAAARGLAQAYSNLRSSQQRQNKTTGAVHRAEQRLSRDRRKYGADSNRVKRDENLLAQAKRRNAAATREVNQVQRLSGASLKLYNHLTVVAAASTKLRIRDLRQEARNLYRKWQQDKNNTDLAKRAQQRYSELNREQKKLSSLYQEAGAKSGPKLQRTIERLTLVQATYGKNLRGLSSLQATLPRKTESATEKTLKNWGHFTDVFKKRTAQPFKGDVRSMNTTATTGMVGTAQTANQMLRMMGVDTEQFHINRKGEVVQTKQSGGFIVPGSSQGDSYRTKLPAGSFILNRRATAAFGLQRGGQVPVVLEPGERAFMPHEVRRFGQGNLEALNAAVPRFQKGGKLTEPQLMGPAGALRSIGQGAIRKVYEGAKEYLAKNRPGGIGVPGAAPKGFKELLKKWKPSHPRWDVWQVGLLLQKMGYSVSENPHFGGVDPVHSNGSYHYSGRAIDVNADSAPGGEAAALDRLYASLSRIPHTELLWRVADHYDHLHYAYQRGGHVGSQRLASGGLVGMVGPILLRNGLDVESAAGILGNAWQESKWKTSSVGSGGGGLWGFTTSPVSLADMQAYADRRGMPWTSALAQTQFMLHHLSQSYRNRMNAMGSVEETTEFFMNEWERPNAELANLPERIRGAQKALGILESGVGAGGGGVKAKPKTPKTLKGKYKRYRVIEHGDKPDELVGLATHYKVTTTPLSFGGLPSDLDQVNKELRIRQRELAEYRAAIRAAKAKATKEALQANVTLLERRVEALRQKRIDLVRQRKSAERIKKIGQAAEFAHWTGPTGVFAQKEGRYNELAEKAEQIVSLEPTEPSGAGPDWIESKLVPYISTTETDAYKGVLDIQAQWRNEILGAQSFATDRMRKWREQISTITDKIKTIKKLKEDNPAAYRKQKSLIPGFEQQRDALRGNISKTRDNTLKEWEESLQGLQGLGRTHEVLAALPPEPSDRFGGSIFETQLTIKDLGLKIEQAREGSKPDDSERAELYRQLAMESNQRNVIRGIEEAILPALPKVGSGFQSGGAVGIMPPYGGRAHVGAVVPGPPGSERTMVVKSGEGIFTPEQMAAMGIEGAGGNVRVNVHGDIVSSHADPVDVLIGDRRFQAEVRKVTGQDNRRQARGAGRGLATPGVFSR